MEGISVADGMKAHDRPLISVVMPVRNGMPWIEEQLRALSAQRGIANWEAVVADNGSGDGTRACVEQWSARDPRIRLVDASARLGAGAARNAGVRAAQCSMIAFCDADDVVQPGWLEALQKGLADSDLVAGMFDMEYLNGHSPSHPIPPATQQLGFLPFALGANLAVRRDAFEAVGGFRERLAVEEHADLLIGEDVDLCWRMQLAGYRFASAADAIVAKRGRSSGRASLRTGWAYGRSGPALFQHYRVKGMKRNLRGAAKSWAWLMLAIPHLLSPSRRGEWLRVLGVRTGRLAASVTHRVFFP